MEKLAKPPNPNADDYSLIIRVLLGMCNNLCLLASDFTKEKSSLSVLHLIAKIFPGC